MNRGNTFLLVVFLFSIALSGQSPVLDSLKSLTLPSQANAATHQFYINFCKVYMKTSLDSAETYCLKALHVAEKTGEQNLLAESNFQLSVVNGRKRKSARSLEFSQKALEKYRAISDTAGIIKSLNAVATGHMLLSQYPEALSNYLASIKLDEKIGNKKSMAGTLSNMSYIESRRGNLGAAIKMLEEAWENIKDTDDDPSKLSILNAMGYNYYGLERYKDAIHYLQIHVNLAEQTHDDRALSYGLSSLANAYAGENKLDTAISLLHRSLNLKEATGQNAGIEHNSLAYFYNEKSDFNLAAQHFQTAIELLAASGDLVSLQDAHRNLSEIFTKQNKHERALEEFRAYDVLRDSILNMEKDEKIEEIKTRYETEKKEQENLLLANRSEKLSLERNIFLATAIAFLIFFAALFCLFIANRNQKRITEQQRDAFRKSNQVKDKLFAIISHDLRTPLTTLSGLAKKVGYLMKRNRLLEVAQLGKTVEDAVTTVRLLLDNLLNWAMVQGGHFPHNPEQHYAIDVVTEVLEVYMDTAEAKDISLSMRVAENAQLFADRQAVATILRNLVDNALKYTCENGEVKVTAKQTDKHTIIRVKDSGQGIPSENLDNIFAAEFQRSKRGTKGEKGSGLGLALCTELVEMNNGKIRVESSEGKGSVFCVELPSQK